MYRKSESDYIDLKKDNEILKDYYPIAYIRKNYIDSNYYTLKKRLKISDGESFFHSNTWYIKKECIERYLEYKNKNQSLIGELKNSGYFPITEYLEKYSIKGEESALRNFIKQRKGVDLKKDNKGNLFIHKDSFDRFLFEHEYRKNSYDFVEVMKMLNFDHTTLRKHTMINFRKVLKKKLDNEKFGNLI